MDRYYAIEMDLLTAARTLKRIPDPELARVRTRNPDFKYYKDYIKLSALPGDITIMDKVLFKWWPLLDAVQKKVVWCRVETGELRSFRKISKTTCISVKRVQREYKSALISISYVEWR